MATTHHFSVLANSCVKPPVNPDTGLSVTLHERYESDLHQTWDGRIEDYDGKEGDLQGSTGRLNKTDLMMASLEADWGNMSDAEFYQRLQDLKNEHKKTLDMCESMYSQKVGELRQSNTFSVTNGHSTVNGFSMGGKNHESGQNMVESLNNSYNSFRKRSASPVRDNIKDMSRPPTGRSRPQSAKPSSVRKSMEEYDYNHLEHAQTCYSSDEEHWRPISAVTTDVELSRDEGHDHHHHHHHSHNDSSHSAARSQVEEMWENFSVEEYAPPKTRQRSSSLSRASSAQSKRRSKSDVDTSDWRHRITLPKPFNMSLREGSKIKEKSQTLIEYEMKKDLERRADEEECQKKFKARPVPAHVYMPLFDEKMEEMESRRQSCRESSKDLLKSLEKPFNFMKREEEKKKYSRARREKVTEEVKEKPPTGFKAKPFPAHLFEGNVMDKLQEEEEYRKIRVQMRAEELLKSASLPPNMAAMGKDYIDGKSRQKIYADRAKKAGITVEHKFRPKVNDTVPDFEEQHRLFHSQMSDKKRAKEATVCKPFNLRTERVASKRHKVYEDIAQDAANLRSKTWSFNNSGRSKLSSMRALSSSMDCIPAKMTASAQLRTSATRTKLQQELDAELAELEKQRQQRIKEKKIKKYIAERVAMNDNTKDLERTVKAKIKEYKQSDRARREEYNQMLNEIDERIEKRPLLFERALQANAKRAAERKYKDTLRRMGLDEDFISTKGKEATDEDMAAVSDDEFIMSRHESARSGSPRSASMRSASYRSRTPTLSESRRCSDDHEDGNRTSDGSDLEHD